MVHPSIRFLRPDEAEKLSGQLIQLMRETGHHDPTIDVQQAYGQAGWPSADSRHGHGIAVVIDQDQIVAAVYLEVMHQWCMIWRVAVSPARQRNGLGSNLLGFVLQELSKHGICKVQLFCETDNLPAQELYRSCSFQPQPERYQLWTHTSEE